MDTNDKTMKNEIHRLQERILLLEQNDKLTGPSVASLRNIKRESQMFCKHREII